MSRVLMTTLAYILATALLASEFAQADQRTTILGWVEEVAVLDARMNFQAKIDTGADSSSLNASDIDYMQRDGSTWVRFHLTDHTGAQIAMEQPLVRLVKIKLKEGGFIERPVVTLSLCIAGQQLNAEVNLTNRNHFNYPMLVGRSLMARRFLVDPQHTHLTQPVCTTS